MDKEQKEFNWGLRKLKRTFSTGSLSYRKDSVHNVYSFYCDLSSDIRVSLSQFLNRQAFLRLTQGLSYKPASKVNETEEDNPFSNLYYSLLICDSNNWSPLNELSEKFDSLNIEYQKDLEQLYDQFKHRKSIEDQHYYNQYLDLNPLPKIKKKETGLLSKLGLAPKPLIRYKEEGSNFIL